jgi:pSer/pThr/pTyr-binding forkhead associated (FHA) protein
MTALLRRHAEVIKRSGLFQIRDLGSTKGTFVNGKRIDARRYKMTIGGGRRETPPFR